MVERLPVKEDVLGSSPSRGARYSNATILFMDFLNFFRKKEKENTADSSAGYVPMTGTSDSDNSDTNTDTPSQGGNNTENTTILDSITSFFGGDGGDASGGDGGGGGN